MALEDLEKKLSEQPQPTAGPSPATASIPVFTPVPAAAAAETKNGLVSNFISRYSRFGKWIFWSLIAITVVTMAVGSFYLYQYFTGRDVSMSLKAPSDVLIGVPFDIDINFSNDSSKVLKDVKLAITLPEGAVPADSIADSNKRFITRDLGDLNASASFETKIAMVVFKNAESVRRFPIAVSYYLAGLGQTTRLEKAGTVEVGVREPAIKLDLSAPQKVMNNEIFEIKVNYQNIADVDFSDIDIGLNLPTNFIIKEVSPTSTTGNIIWKIGRLGRAGGGTVTVKGSVSGAESSFFPITTSAKSSGYLIDEKTASLNIAASPLSIGAKLNDQDNYIAKPDESLRYVLSYKNNADIGFSDVVIKARLTGEMLDFTRLRTKGFFNSINNTITWNVANTPELRLLNPGSQGTVEFEIQTKAAYPIKRLSDKNFFLKLDAEISSPTVPYYVSADKTTEVTGFQTKVRGQATIISKALFRDSASGMENRGPLPPKVNNPTNFTIHWLIKNYSTDISNIEIKSSLLSGVRWTSKSKSNASSSLVYNDRTGEVSWVIDKIPATKGVVGTPLEAIFQIEATPNITQVGQPMPLLAETQFKATDDFTGLEIANSAPALTTQLLADPTFKTGQDTVIQ